MAHPTFLSDTKLCFDELEIYLLQGNSSAELAVRDDLYYMLKSRPYVNGYEKVKRDLSEGSWPGPSENVLEIGVFRGGSAPFLHRLFDAKRLVCIEYLTEPPPPLERFKSSCKEGEVRTHYGVDQADRETVERILASDFDGPIDLVVDDASHRYSATKACFETVFPFVRPGGIYVIEDWSWANDENGQKPDHYLAHEPALTNLVFEFVIALGAGNGLLDGIGFGPSMMWVRKSWRKLPKGEFRLNDYLLTRGRSITLL